MKKLPLFVLCTVLSFRLFSQERPINKLTLESTYSYLHIHKALRDLVDQADRSSYFDDSFFNTLLRKIVTDKQFADKEKAYLFYLMNKKLGFAFVGVNYMPPKQSYFQFFMGQVQTWAKTRFTLKDLNYNTSALLSIADTLYQKDAVLASNALLLATILNPDASAGMLEKFTKAEVILQAKNPDIFHHYVCLSAGLKQNEVITANLEKNVLNFKNEAFIEDALCALYAKNNHVSTIKDYVLKENNPQNDLAIQTALGALYARVPPATFEKSLKEFIDEAKEKWKKELLKNLLAKKIPYYYSLADKEQVVTKKWEGVTLSLYTDGSLMTNGALLEFDPN